MDKYKNNGEATCCTIPKKDAKIVAKIWGEGYEPLEKFLEYSILNGLQTLACCSGHDLGLGKYETPYVLFNIVDNIGERFIYAMSKEKSLYSISFIGNGRINSIGLYSDFENRKNFFETMQSTLNQVLLDKDDKTNSNNFIGRMIELVKYRNFNKHYMVGYFPRLRKVEFLKDNETTKEISVEEMEGYIPEMKKTLDLDQDQSTISIIKEICRKTNSGLSQILLVPKMIRDRIRIGKEETDLKRNFYER